MSYYKKHMFFCTNNRTDNKKCCNSARAEEFCHYAKTQAKTLELARDNVRVNLSGCLGRCTEGPVLVIYPDSVWYTYSSKEDIDEILFSHIQNNTLVKHLQLKPKCNE